LTAVLLVTACQKKDTAESADSKPVASNAYTEFETTDFSKAAEELSFTPSIPKTLPIETAEKTYMVMENKKDPDKETFVYNVTPQNKDDGFIYISYSNEMSNVEVSGDNVKEVKLTDGTAAYLTNGFVKGHEEKVALMLTWKKDGYEYFISYHNVNFTEEEKEKALLTLANDIDVK
jgi:hypothetical protein